MVRKRLNCFFAIFVMVCMLCASCGQAKSSTEVPESGSDSMSSVSESSSPEEVIIDDSDFEKEDKIIDNEESLPSDESEVYSQEDINTNFELLRAANFRENKALIKFKDTLSGREYIGIIDKEGNLGSTFTCDTSRGDMDDEHLYWGYDAIGDWYNAEFENGYTYLYSMGHVYLIDRDGNVLTDYQAGKTICFGGGYFMLEEHLSGFDENKYVYTIVDKDGREIDRLESSEKMEYGSYAYCGDGVFAYILRPYDYEQFIVRIVFAKSGQVLDQQVANGLKNIFCEDGYIVYFSDCIKDSESGEWIYEFTYSDLDGNWKDVIFPDEYLEGSSESPIICDLKNGRVLFRKGKDYYFIYDINAGEFKKYEGRYADSLGWLGSAREAEQSYGIGSDGTMAIQLKGKDGEDYIGLIDKDMNEVCEPIYTSSTFFAYGSFYIYDDLLYVVHNYEEVDVYDLKGNHVFWSSDLAGFKRFSEGLAVSIDPFTDKRSYITIDGDEAFQINYANLRLVF